MKYVIANWKMNMSVSDVVNWCTSFRDLENNTEIEKGKKIIVAPSFVHLTVAHSLLYKSSAFVAAQDISLKERGNHTSQVGGFQIKEFCRYCIIGHSETGDNISTIRKKAEKCFESRLIPIICFKDIHDASKVYFEDSIVCWEDPNNISKHGHYVPKNISDIKSGFSKIRKILPKSARVLYGGSVNGQNASELVKIDGLDGFLVGNASLKISTFVEILNEIH